MGEGEPREQQEESFVEKMMRELRGEQEALQHHADELRRISEKNKKREPLTEEEREFLKNATTSSSMRKIQERIKKGK